MTDKPLREALDDWPEPEGSFDEVLERSAQTRFGPAATYTAAEVKVLTETASKVALELGREESRAELEALRALWWFIQDDFGVCDNGHGASITWAEANQLDELHDAIEMLYQESGYPPRPSTQPSVAVSDATSGAPRRSEVSEAPKAPQEPCEDPECPVPLMHTHPVKGDT